MLPRNTHFALAVKRNEKADDDMELEKMEIGSESEKWLSVTRMIKNSVGMIKNTEQLASNDGNWIIG